MDDVSGIDVFCHMVLGLIMTYIVHDKLTNFLNIKPPTFMGSESENIFEFIIDCS